MLVKNWEVGKETVWVIVMMLFFSKQYAIIAQTIPNGGFEAIMTGNRYLIPYRHGNFGQRAYFWSYTQINSSSANEVYIINNDSHACTDQEDN